MEYKFNTQKAITFLRTNDKPLENKNLKIIPFTLAQQILFRNKKSVPRSHSQMVHHITRILRGILSWKSGGNVGQTQHLASLC